MRDGTAVQAMQITRWPHAESPPLELREAVADGRSRVLVRASQLPYRSEWIAAVMQRIDLEWGEPQRDLGYDVPACPFITRMRRQDALWITSTPTPCSPGDFVEEFASLLAAFPDLPPRRGSGQALKAAVVVLRDCDAATGEHLVTSAYRELKSLAVGSGLLIGEFYRTCSEPGSSLPRLQTKRGVVEYLAVRSMIPPDLKYLRGNGQWESAYRRRFPA